VVPLHIRFEVIGLRFEVRFEVALIKIQEIRQETEEKDMSRLFESSVWYLLVTNSLTQLHQNPVRTLGMQKANQLIVRSAFGLLVEQAESLTLEALHLGLDILDLNGDVVDAFAPFFDKFGNSAVGIGALQKFHLGFTDLEKGGVDVFRGYFFYFIVAFAKKPPK
jgi:hypothetical protein